MMENLKFKKLKFRSKINYGTPEEEQKYFYELNKKDPQLALEKTMEIYYELMEITWSQKLIGLILSFVTLILSGISHYFNLLSPLYTITIFGVSLSLFAYYSINDFRFYYLKKFYNNLYNEYIKLQQQ